MLESKDTSQLELDLEPAEKTRKSIGSPFHILVRVPVGQPG